MLGLLSSSIGAIFLGPLHYRALQRVKVDTLRQGMLYDDCLVLTPEAREELVWWLQYMDAWNGRAIFWVLPGCNNRIRLDLSGSVAHCWEVLMGDLWSPEEASLHKQLRAVGGDICYQQSNEGQGSILHPSQNGQCISCSVHKPSGGNSIHDFGSPCQRILGVLSSTPELSTCRTHCRSKQCHCGFVLPILEGLQQLDPAQEVFQYDSEGVRSLQDRPVCNSPEPPTGAILHWRLDPNAESFA
nr:PREDICTED: uncharacterized protein LOC102348257 isoform X2 [Latimeria chalumnae]|eukprot:XP_006002749.1 PREDICTED: uncharacterized protein LOC102348257 isoform X2 [Latimeria chalumnae]